MCGILGTVNQKIDKNILNLIYHRGPDEQELIEKNFSLNKLYFGHTRLAIQDLSSAGSQPMSTDDDRYTIIFNGEVYNHYDLRKDISGIDYKGHSDTETILHYLSQNGIGSVCNLNGIFALSFYDSKKGKLYLARDPFGVKPLYYKIKENSLIYSSEIKTIKAFENDTLSYDNLYTFLTLRYNPSPQTLFKNIQKIEPGHYIEYDLNQNKIVNNYFYSYKPTKNYKITE